MHSIAPNFPLCGVAVDSRQIKEGNLFFALKGEKADGHNFLQIVYEKGACGAVIHHSYKGLIPPLLPIIRVENSLIFLQELAREWIEKNNPTVVAITGSFGKTTTKEFAATIFQQHAPTAYTQGNQNSQIGFPLSILNTIKGHEKYFIAEMGMDKIGGIKSLTKIAPPNIALITNIGLCHAVNFENLEQIALAKAEIFQASSHPHCLYNADTLHTEILHQLSHKTSRTFSSKQKAFWHLLIDKETLTCTEESKTHTLPKPNFTAPHHYDNLLAAIALARTAGIPWNTISKALPLLSPPSKRLQIENHKNILFINDSYNAAEIPMKAALDLLATYKPLRRIAVLGQMLELGAFSMNCHERVGHHALSSADLLYCLGKECEPIVTIWKQQRKKVFWAASLEELSQQLQNDLQSQDVVLLKGSRNNQLWKILEHFQEASS